MRSARCILGALTVAGCQLVSGLSDYGVESVTGPGGAGGLGTAGEGGVGGSAGAGGMVMQGPPPVEVAWSYEATGANNRALAVGRTDLGTALAGAFEGAPDFGVGSIPAGQSYERAFGLELAADGTPAAIVRQFANDPTIGTGTAFAMGSFCFGGLRSGDTVHSLFARCGTELLALANMQLLLEGSEPHGSIAGVEQVGEDVLVAGDFVGPLRMGPVAANVIGDDDGQQDGFIARANEGAAKWRLHLEAGSSSHVEIHDMSQAGSTLWVIGSLKGTMSIGGGAIQLGPSEGVDGFILQIDISGTPTTDDVNALLVEHPGEQRFWRITALPDGALVGGGFTGGVKLGIETFSAASNGDAFVVRYNLNYGVVERLILSGPPESGPHVVKGLARSGEQTYLAVNCVGDLQVGPFVAAFEETTSDATGLDVCVMALEGLDAEGGLRALGRFGDGNHDEATGLTLVDDTAVVGGWFTGSMHLVEGKIVGDPNESTFAVGFTVPPR